jgi:phospholipid/cholesterol/gamma-HCH transport system substrate-binding protein
METRANYVLIGIFALAGFLGLLGFVLWFAQVELDRQFDYYDVRFTSVSGLSRASEVRFAGLPVGQVVSVQLSPGQDGTVTARLEVKGDTPVRTDSVATIESMGVTGVSYVGISPGNPDSPLLKTEGEIPEIESGRSVLQTLSEDAPKIVDEALAVMENISALLNDENQRKVQQILDNLARSSGDLSQALTDFSGVSETIAGATADIAGFAEQLNPVVAAVEGTLGNLDGTLNALTSLSGRIETSLDEADAALQSGRVALDAAEMFMTGELPAISQDLTATTLFLREQSELLVTDARAMLDEFAATGRVATRRLTEAEAAIDRLVGTLDSVDKAAASFNGLVAGDGTALVAETRAMVANANSTIAAIDAVAQTDLPAIVADIRSATETVNRVVAEVGADLSGATGRIDGLADDAARTMEQVTGTFANANQTLAAIDAALVTGERSLRAAERAFAGADRLLNEDAAAITADLRRVMQRLDGTIATVSEDIPAVTEDLRAAAGTARRAFEEFAQVVADSGAPVQQFATTGLPQYTRLARETRNLIATLESLARQIERDPARFFLNRQTPEFRR